MILPCSLVKIQYCPQEVLVAQFSLDGHKDGPNPHSFHLNKVTEHYIINIIYLSCRPTPTNKFDVFLLWVI